MTEARVATAAAFGAVGLVALIHTEPLSLALLVLAAAAALHEEIQSSWPKAAARPAKAFSFKPSYVEKQEK